MLAGAPAYVYNGHTIAINRDNRYGVYMKKRIALLLVLIIALSVCIGALVGCDAIITRNEDRDANQVVASVSYAGQTADIRKFELAISFNSYAYIYNAYYGMTYQQAADYLLQSLAQRELLVLFAKDELVKMEDPGASAVDVKVEDLLSSAELNRAIENVNEDILSAIDTAIGTLISANKPSTGGSSDSGEYEEYSGTDAITVRFDSGKGSAVERQRIKNGTVAYEPDDPTREGYTFYGWYTDKDCTEAFDFSKPVTLEEGTKSITLYAKWEPYLEPRPVREAEEEDPDADYDPDGEVDELAPRALDDSGLLTEGYRALIMSGEAELDSLSTYSEAVREEYLKEYLDDAVEDVADDFDDLRTSYQYYLDNEMKTLLITRLERKIGEQSTVSQAEIEARFDSMVEANIETYGGNRTSYETALTDALASSYYHEYEGYGFVLNILLQLPDDDLAKLTEMVEDGVYSGDKSTITKERDKLLKAIEVNVSNPDYDPDYICDRHSCEAGSDCDPMTCPNHECVDEVNEGADWNNIVKFVYDKDTKVASIEYGVTACPAMAYLPGTVPAFTNGGERTGIVEQIYASFSAVKQAVADGMSPVLGVYWMREVATAWLYLVGDDSGGTSSDSNNGGLGYMITPEGEESGYIESFTEQARALIENGTASYERRDGAGATEGNFYVFGDNFIESGTTSGAYAGIFILVATCVPLDDNLVGIDADGNETALTFADNGSGKELPLDYIVEYAPTLEDCVTIRQQIEETLLTGKQSALYEEKVNAFGVKHYETIVYNREAYESLWKDLS